MGNTIQLLFDRNFKSCFVGVMKTSRPHTEAVLTTTMSLDFPLWVKLSGSLYPIAPVLRGPIVGRH